MGGGGAAGGDFDALLASKDSSGWRGLFKNYKVFLITCFSSLGGVLYGYNQGEISMCALLSSDTQVYSVKCRSCQVSNTDTLNT